jgi:hypothetical protein
MIVLSFNELLKICNSVLAEAFYMDVFNPKCSLEHFSLGAND